MSMTTTPLPSPSSRPEGSGGHDALPQADPAGESDRATFWQRNGLALACFGLFAVFLVGQSITGWHVHNEDQVTHGGATIGYLPYLASGHFVEATFENWESEFLQMFAFVLLTAWLVQRGSAESKPEDDAVEDAEMHRDDPTAPWPVRRGGIWLKVYEQSLMLAFLALFLMSIAAHAAGGLAEHNAELESHHQSPDTVAGFVTSSEFWFQSFQNWQSEFLAVGAIAVLTIFLRQKGSPESKPIHAPHWQTGTNG
jgi:Domain of unknown function (DUF6766)